MSTEVYDYGAGIDDWVGISDDTSSLDWLRDSVVVSMAAGTLAFGTTISPFGDSFAVIADVGSDRFVYTLEGSTAPVETLLSMWESERPPDDAVVRDEYERTAVAAVEQLIAEYARARRVTAQPAAAYRVENEEDGVDQIFVTQRVQLNSSDALDYWDAIGVAVDRLASESQREVGDIIRTRVTVNIEWPVRAL